MKRKSHGGKHLVAGLLCAALPAISSAATLTIDPSVTYRTIDGLGFCTPPLTMYSVYNGPFPEEAPWLPFADTLINYVGMTMSRGFDTQSCDFNPSPGEFVITDGVRKQLQRQQDLVRIAAESGEDYRYCPNVFSPAPWMKRNNQCHSSHGYGTWPSDSTNSLKPDHYDDFGALCSAFVRIAIDSFNVPVYAISPQNEPCFNTPYASCVYRNGRHYAEMFRFFGASVKRASPTTLTYGSEHMPWNFPSWELAVVNDPQAEPYFDRFAVHNATDPFNVDTNQWPSMMASRARDLWISEDNFTRTNYDSTFRQIANMMDKLGSGANATGWMIGGNAFTWKWNGNSGGGTSGAKVPGFYLLSQIMRFVRPGMTRVKATKDDPMLRVLAYKNDEKGSFSVVVQNLKNEDVPLTLNSTGTIPDSLEMRTTSSTQNFVEGPVQDGQSPVTVPARGMVSLGFRIRGRQPSSGLQPVASLPRQRTALQGPVRLFDLRGRTLNRATAYDRPAGAAAAVVVRRDASGRASVAVHGVWAVR